MKKTGIFVIVFLCCSVTWMFVQSDNREQSASAVDDSQVILAEYRWNGDSYQISMADLNAEIAQLPAYRQRNYKTRAGKAEYLDELIVERLKILRATEEGFDKLPEYLEKLQDYTHQLMVEKLTKMEVDEKATYNDEDLRNHYQTNLREYVEPEKVRATCITVEDEDLANETLDAIQAGKNIAEMAKELFDARKFANGPGANEEDPGNTNLFSRSGSARWSEFIEAVFAQEIGEMTETVFEIDVSDKTFYLIFRKEEYQPERQKEFEEVRDDVERTVGRAKKRARIQEWVAEISEKGRLKTYPENIPEPMLPEEVEAEDPEE